MGKRGPMPKNKLPAAKPLDTAECVPSRAYKPSKSEIDERRRYRAEDALRDFERTERYKSDKQLMSDVKQLATEKMEALKKI